MANCQLRERQSITNLAQRAHVSRQCFLQPEVGALPGKGHASVEPNDPCQPRRAHFSALPKTQKTAAPGANSRLWGSWKGVRGMQALRPDRRRPLHMCMPPSWRTEQLSTRREHSPGATTKRRPTRPVWRVAVHRHAYPASNNMPTERRWTACGPNAPPLSVPAWK